MKKAKRHFSLLLVMAMILSGMPINAFAKESGSVSLTGEYYDVDAGGNITGTGMNDPESTIVDTESGAYIKMSKSAAATGNENEFTITLNVETMENAKELLEQEAVSVVLVFDVSRSMDFTISGIDPLSSTSITNGSWKLENTRWTALKEVARDFIEELFDANPNNQISIVVYGGASNGNPNTVVHKTICDWTSNATAAINTFNVYQFVDQTDADYYTTKTGFSGGTALTQAVFGDAWLTATNCQAGFRGAIETLGNDTTGNDQYVIYMSDGQANCSYTYSGTAENGTNHIDAAKAEAALLKALPANPTIYTIGFTSDAANSAVLSKTSNTNVTEYYPATNADGLAEIYEEILSNVYTFSQVWTVTDPMPDYVDLDISSIIAENDTAYSLNGENVLTWDLKNCEPSYTTTDNEGNTVYGYTLTYTVTVNPDEFQNNEIYPLNMQTTLTYVFSDEEGNIGDPETTDFLVPTVKLTETDSMYHKPATKTLTKIDEASVSEGTEVNDGDRITYEIGYDAPAGTEKITIEDTLPEGTSYVSSDPVATLNDGAYKWEIDVTSAEDQSGSVTLVLDIDSIPAGVAKLENKAMVSYKNSSGDDIVTPDEPWIENPVGITYTVTYLPNVGTGSYTDADIPSGTVYTVLSQSDTGISRNNYTFTGWNTAANGNGTAYAAGDTITVNSDVTLYAQWEYSGGITPTTYTVTYNANGGTGSHQDTGLSSGSSYTVKVQSATGIARDGYTFKGWNTRADGSDTAYVAGNTITITGNMTLYAQWEKTTEEPTPDDGTYTVVYNPNGGTGTAYSVTEDVGSAHSVLANSNANLGFTRSGYSFRGWSTSASVASASYFGTGSEAIGADADAGDTITLYAVWTILPGPGGIIPGVDIEDDDVPLGALDLLNHFAYIIGYPDGTVLPEGNITRAEVATIFFRLLTLDSRAEVWSKGNSFPDVGSAEWYNNAISTLMNGNIIKGYPGGTFRPNASITRAEFAAIAVKFATAENIANATGMAAFNDISGHWAENYIALAGTLGYVQGYGDGTFRPDAPITRAEVATLLNNVLNRHVESGDDMTSDMVTWPDNQPGTWYYYALQEATNSHFHERKDDGINEIWTEIRPRPDWVALEKSDSVPGNVSY